MNGPLLRLAVLNTTIFGFLKLHAAHKHNLAHAPTSLEIEETLKQSLQHHSINEFLETFADIRDRSCPPGRQIDWAIVAHVADYLWLRSVLVGLPPSYPHDKPAWQLVLVVLRRHFPFLDEEQLGSKDVHELISCIHSQEHLDVVACHNIISRICIGKDSQGQAEIVACKDMIDRRSALWNAIAGDDDEEDAINAQFMGYHEHRPDNANDIEDDEVPDPNDQLLQEMKVYAIRNKQNLGNQGLRELRQKAHGIVTSAKEITKQIRGNKADGSRTLGARLAVSDNDYQEILQSGKEYIIEQLHKKLGKNEQDEQDDKDESYDPFSQTCPQKAPQDVDTDMNEDQPETESETNDEYISDVSQVSVFGNNKTNVDNLYEQSTMGSGATTDRQENMREQVATDIEEQSAVHEQIMSEVQAAVEKQATAGEQTATGGQATDGKQAATNGQVTTKRDVIAEERAAINEQTATGRQVAPGEQATIEECVAAVVKQVSNDEHVAVGTSSNLGMPNPQGLSGITGELSTNGENLVGLTSKDEEKEATGNLQHIVNVETSVGPEGMAYRNILVNSRTKDGIDDIEMSDEQFSAGLSLNKCYSPELQEKKRKRTTDDGNDRQRKRREAENTTPGEDQKPQRYNQKSKKRPRKGGKRIVGQYSASCFYPSNLQPSRGGREAEQERPVPFGDVKSVHLHITSDMSMVIYRLFPRETARSIISNCFKLLEEQDYVAYYALLYTTLRDYPNIKDIPQSTAAVLNQFHEKFVKLPNAPSQTQVEDAIRNEYPQFSVLIYDKIGPILVAQKDLFQVWNSILQDCDQLLHLQTICLKLYKLIAQDQINETLSFDAMAFEKSMMAALKQSSCALMIIRIVKSGMVSCGVDFQDCNPVTEEEFQTLFSRIHVAFDKLKKQKCSGAMYMANAVPARTDRAQRRSRSILTLARRRGLTLLTPATIKTHIDVDTSTTEPEKNPQVEVGNQSQTHTDPVVKVATATDASCKSPKLLKIKEGFFLRPSLKPPNALRDSQKEKHLQLANCVAFVGEKTAKNIQDCLERPGREEEYYLVLLSLVRTRKIHVHILPESAQHILSPVLNDDLEMTVRVDSAIEWQLYRWFLLLRPWRPSQDCRDTDKDWAEMLAHCGGPGSAEFLVAFETVLAEFRATIRLEVGDLLEYESQCLEIAMLRNKMENKVVLEAGSPPHGHKTSQSSDTVDQMMTENSPISCESEAVENATPSLADPPFQDSSVPMEDIQFSYNDWKTELVSETQAEGSCSEKTTERADILQSDATRKKAFPSDRATQIGRDLASGNDAQRMPTPGSHETTRTETAKSNGTTQMEGPLTCDSTTQTGMKIEAVPDLHQTMQTETFFQQLTQPQPIQSGPIWKELPNGQFPSHIQDSTRRSRNCAPEAEYEKPKSEVAFTRSRLDNDSSPQKGSTATETKLVRLREDIRAVSEEVHLSLADALTGKLTRPPEPISNKVINDLDLRNLSLVVLNGFYSLASRCTAQKDAFHHTIQQEKDISKMQLELLKATAATRNAGQAQDSVDLQMYREAATRFLQIMATTTPPYPHRSAMEPEDLINALTTASELQLNMISAEWTAAVVQCMRRCLGADCGAKSRQQQQQQQQQDREAVARFKHILRTIEKRFHQAADMLGTGWKGEKAFLSMIDRRVLSEFRRALELQDDETSELVEAVLAILQFCEKRQSLSAHSNLHLRIPDQTPITVDNAQWFILGATTDSAKPHNRCDVIMMQARTQRGRDGMQLHTRMENMTKLLRRLDARGAAAAAEQIYKFCARESIRTNQLPLGVRAKDIVCSGSRYMLRLRDLATPQGPYTATALKHLGAHLQGWMGMVPGQEREQAESYCRPTQHAVARVLVVANY
ncbi:hypothetical protein MY3296_008507 [Beauveria thailandica]